MSKIPVLEDTLKPLVHWLASLAWLVSCKPTTRSHPHPKVFCTEEGHLRLTSGLYVLIAQNHILHSIRKLRDFSTRPTHWNPDCELLSFCHSLTTGFFCVLTFCSFAQWNQHGLERNGLKFEHNYIWVWILVLSFSVILRSFLGFLPYWYPHEGWSALNYCTPTAWMFWEMAQWLNHLPYKCKDQSSDAQSSCKCQVGMAAHLWFQS